MSYVIEARCTTCASAECVYVAPSMERRARCAACIKAGRQPTGPALDVDLPPVLVPHQPRPAAPVAVEPYPAPEHTSRDPWPDGVEVPGPVQQVRRLAESNGWAVRLTYARGNPPHRATGRPGVLVETVALQASHPGTRSCLVAVHVIGKGWDGIIVASPEIPPFAGCSITDAKGFLKTHALDLDAIRWRNHYAGIRDKVWADYCKGSTLAAMSAKYEVGKEVAMKIVQQCRESGKAKPGRAKRKVETVR